MLEVGKHYRFLYDIKCHTDFYRGTWIDKDSIDKGSVALLLETQTKSNYPNMFYVKFLCKGKIYYVNYAFQSEIYKYPEKIFERVEK